jgi:putative molybdopterin biosynthesis protein
MKEERDVYLHDIPLDEAWARFTGALEAGGRWEPLPGESIPVADACGRVTAEPVWARMSSPHYHASAMDGYAVRAGDTAGATETRPVQLQLVGSVTGQGVEDVARPAQAVNTGAPLPLWADAIIMVEDAQLLDDEDRPRSSLERPTCRIEIRASVARWQHVRPMGEDMVATELVLPANHVLRPVDLGAIAGSGHSTVCVRRKPRVAIVPTGSELVPVDREEPVRPGEIVEYNSMVLAAQVEGWGGQVTRWPIVADCFDDIRAAVREAAGTHDLVLVNAGSSAGTEDYTASVVADLGKVLVHGVAVRPGHPVILGVIGNHGKAGNQVPVVGVPGYPVSAALTGEILVEPLLARWLGRPSEPRPTIEAAISRQVLSPMGDDEFLRVAVGQVGKRVVATPLGRGAGTISSLVRADGIVLIPRFSEGLQAGEIVTVKLYRSSRSIANSVVAVGSHDLTVDLLAQFLAERVPGMRLTSANVGSLGGLMALRRGEAHVAGCHLLDPETGEYNRAYVSRYLPGREVVLVTLVEREQGFMVPAGNPAGLSGWDDLQQGELRYVNRQRGAGTRVLLDYELARRGIAGDSVAGYERQEYTHLAVAAAIASGTADYGLGIRAAASALGLDFVTLAFERYDLAIPREHYESDLLRPLLELLSDEAFRAAVLALPGYDAGRMGETRIVKS